MKLPKLLILLGIILVIVGAVVAQISAKGESREEKRTNLSLTETNPAFTIDLGNLKQGTKLKISFGLEGYTVGGVAGIGPRILIMVMRPDTKTYVLETKYKRPVMNSTGEEAGAVFYLDYDVQEEANYVVVVNRSPKPAFETIKVIYFTVLVSPPATLPYVMPGAGIVIAGLALMAFGIVKRKAT